MLTKNFLLKLLFWVVIGSWGLATWLLPFPEEVKAPKNPILNRFEVGDRVFVGREKGLIRGIYKPIREVVVYDVTTEEGVIMVEEPYLEKYFNPFTF